MKNLSTLPANTTLTQCWSNAGPLSAHWSSTGSTPRVCWAVFNSLNPKHLYNIWLSVVDGGPTLAQHWVNVSCLTACTIDTHDRPHRHTLSGRNERTKVNQHIPTSQRRDRITAVWEIYIGWLEITFYLGRS